MLLILPYYTLTRNIYGCSTDYNFCGRLLISVKRNKIRSLIQFFESDYLLGLDGYRVLLSPASGYRPRYLFAVSGSGYRVEKIGCAEAIQMIVKSFRDAVIEEPKRRDPKYVFEVIKWSIGRIHRGYVLVPWRVWTIDRVPKGVKISRFIISNGIVLMMT